MTRLGSQPTSTTLLCGLLLLAAAGCPRQDFDLGDDDGGKAGSGDGEAGSGGSASSGKSCGSRGLPECADDEFCSFPSGASCGETDKPGTCQKKTKGDVACPAIYSPVCGCDGKTYGNSCEANASNASIRDKGECEANGGKSCGGLTGAQCAKNEYCDFAPDAQCGAADQTGTCKTKPNACTDIYQPVCGCNDKTYGNACEAHTAGVSVVSDGECKPSGGGKSCGGLVPAGTDNKCGDDQFCDFPIDAICGAADAPGTCRDKPTVCTLEYAPVCGCDGKTYATACAAASSGMSVASKGECKDGGNGSGATCGTRGAAACADTEFCAWELDAQCGAADAPGKCQARPEVCDDIYAPVCGCDGNTYSSECVANSKGAAAAYKGECDGGSGSGKNCGGIAGLQCDGDGEYCNFPTSTMCGSGDQFGQCAKKPTACTKEFHQVCGCDGTTYANPCMAASAGTSIVSEGPCSDTSGNKVCGGLTGAQCADSEYCDFAIGDQCGAADQTGKCLTKPDVCTKELKEVCGCDDKTYGNACEAHSVGVSVAADGACGGTGSGSGETCGGLRGAKCVSGEYCDFAIDAQCGAADQTGTCKTVPTVCTQEFHEVCGCDGKTYPNPCGAHAAGTSIVADAACSNSDGSGQSCGGLTGAQCPSGEYCDWATDAQCGAADQTGLCKTKPQVCTDIAAPVCGCDDKTYGNECSAHAVGVSVTHTGGC